MTDKYFTQGEAQALLEFAKALREDLKQCQEFNRKLLYTLTALEAAKAYIKDLEEHEGAEGFSTSTAILGAKYRELLSKKE